MKKFLDSDGLSVFWGAVKDWVESKSYLTEHQDISGKQDNLTAGDNITIAADNKTISATDTKYTITIDI